MSGVALHVGGAVAELELGAPPVNAFTPAFLQAVGSAVAAVPAEVGALVVTSSVPRVFAAGGDIGYMARAELAEQTRYVQLCQDVYGAFERIAVPTVAAIDGACLGGGLELALACDVRVVAENARLGLPEATLGILAGGGAIHRLVRAVGQAPARDLLLSGRRVTGAEAVRIGLASRLTAAGEATSAGRALAATLAGLDPDALGAVKAQAWGASEPCAAPGT